MTEPDPRGEILEHEERIDLSETFEKSAEVISFDPSDSFEPPASMALDAQPEAPDEG